MKPEEIRKVDSRGVKLSVRQWRGQGNSVSIVYVHGIQSHSAWAVESAQWLFARGFDVFAYDRAGSGLSGGTRGHMASYSEAVEDLHNVILHVKEQSSCQSLFVMALCWGAKLAAVHEIERPGEVDGLILLTPGISTRLTVPFLEKAKLVLDLVRGGQKPFRLPLSDSMFTDDRKYLDFIAGDDLSLRNATSRFLFESRKMDQVALRDFRKIGIPILCFLAGRDPIVDNNLMASLVESAGGTVVRYPDVLHSVEFNERAREQMLETVAGWISSVPSVRSRT